MSICMSFVTVNESSPFPTTANLTFSESSPGEMRRIPSWDFPSLDMMTLYRLVVPLPMSDIEATDPKNPDIR